MRISYVVDLLGFAGLACVGAGLYLCRPAFALIFAGAALLYLARALAAAEARPKEK